MPVKFLDHVQLAMPAGREADARAFYQGVLGIPEVKKPAILAKRGGCWFERGTLKIHLGVEADFRPARKAFPTIRPWSPTTATPTTRQVLPMPTILSPTAWWRAHCRPD